jgi:hypothetical protein
LEFFVDACLGSIISHPRVSFLFLFQFTLKTYQNYRTVDSLSLTPAWDPPEDQPSSSSWIASKQPDKPQYPLLDEQLIGTQLKVVVNGEHYRKREVVISIVKVDGVVSIQHQVYNASKGLAPSWVSSKNPNLTRNNGLLVVVQGEHCGKYVRRVHHRYHEDNGKKQVIITLAVVKRVDGAADTLTGEQLELDPDSLCLAFKTTEDKKLNANLMNSLCKNACKRI